MNQAVTFQATRPIIPAGTQLNGIYEIDEPIAAGGMGEIYKGHAIETGDVVAIKLIRSDLAETDAASALFRKEASALHNLYHEAIVRYYVYTTDPVLGRPYLAMEYVDGQSLSALLRGGPLAFEAVYRLMQRIASGLHAAHERGIIHRDVSPDNIIIPGGDMARAKIIDFGIARSTRLGEEGTIIGSGFAGKYNYVSPEQLGLFGGEVTPKSDIYSLGLVLAEALRHGPIDMGGNHVEVIEKRRSVPDLGPVDRRLRPLLEHMLQPNPADRPASMAEVAAWTVDTPVPSVRAQRPPPARSRPAAGGVAAGQFSMVVGAAIGLSIAGAAVLYGVLRPQPQNLPPPPPVLTPDPPPPAPLPEQMRLAKLDLAVSAVGRVDGVPPADPGQRARIDAVTRFVANYDGGDCFLARPVAIGENFAAIEGFGRSTLPFRDLDEAFRRAHGFEPDIGVRQVDPSQCAALRFLRTLQKDMGRPVDIKIAEPSIKSGQRLTGSITGLAGRAASLFVVADDGSLRALPVSQAKDGDALSFSWPAGEELGNGKLQLLVVVAGQKGLTSLRAAPAGSAHKILADTLAEAARTNQALTVAARSFKVSK
jgi:predicted Ser/Thr protein kinase